MSWLEEFVLRNVDPVTLQEPKLPPEITLDILKNEVQLGLVHLLANERKKILFIGRRYNEFIVDLHIISENGNGFEVIQECKKGLDWLWANTPYHRAELRTANKGIVAVAKRCGFSEIGTHKEAFLDANNQWIDDYVYGINRPE